ncbi:MAG: DUF3810 domain-containing protein [Flavobacteriaceae bacterium]|nr:DUF3810 domain-containing protein [Flavobacteriaceae bacterium]
MKNKRFNTYLSLLLVIHIVLVQLAQQFPSFVEKYYSNGIYPIISKFLRILLGWIPFSFGDVLIAFLLVVFIRFVYRLIKTKFQNFVSKLLQLTAVISLLYCCFYWFWGFNYFRESLASNLNIQQEKYTTEQLTAVTKQLVKKLNATHTFITQNDTTKVVNPYTQQQMYLKALDGYKNLSITYPQLTYSYKSVKSSLMSLLQTYNSTSGYLNPLTGEAQVNDMIPKTGYPTTVCHEMAHQIGWAAENEANFVGYLAALNNKDSYFKYAAYRMAFGYLVSELRKHDKEIHREVILSVNKGVLKDFKASSEFWNQYQNPIEPLIKKGYNSYLKANKQSKGIQSYNYVVDLIISYENQTP